MLFAKLGNIVLHYTLEGRVDGLPLVFIHSLGTELRIWDSVVSHFARDFKIVRYDLRGHGLSDSPPGPYSIRDHVNDLAGLLAYVQVEAAIPVGISVGGMIAIAYAAARPERIKALVLCDTGPTIGTAASWNERIETLRQNGMDSMADAILARWVTPSFSKRCPADYRGYYNMLTRTSVIGYTSTCETLRDTDLTEIAQSLKTKTLVLCGSEDISTPPALGRALAESLADARFSLVENAAHLPCIEQSSMVADLIRQFLQETGYAR